MMLPLCRQLALLLTTVLVAPPLLAQDLAYYDTGATANTEISLLAAPANLMVDGVELRDALAALHESSGVAIAYSPSLLPPLRVTCSCKEVTLGEALKTILSGSGFHAVALAHQVLIEPRSQRTYFPVSNRGKTALVSTLETTPFDRLDGAPVGIITGEVTDRQTGAPVASAQILVVGSDLGTLSRSDGSYLLQGVPAGTHMISVQRVGYRTMTTELSVESEETIVQDFELVEQALQLEEIIVTGTAGQARRREIGNAISQLEPGQFAEPVLSTEQALVGKLAGVDVTASNGLLGAGKQIRLRGNVSVTMGNQPLIYIDGVRVPSDNYPRAFSQGDAFSGRGPNLTMSPLNDLNPLDIEQIEIIKGAAATTLYGTEAAAGVIQIFTKQGREGPAVWNAQIDQSLSRVQEFGVGAEPFMGMEPWLGSGHGQRYAVSVRGGGEDRAFYLSGGYENNSGVLPNDTQEKVTVRGNFSFEGFQGLRLDWHTALSRDDLTHTSSGNNAHGLMFNVYRIPSNPVGSAEKEDLDQLLDQELLTLNTRFNTGITGTYAPMASFSNRLTIGYDRMESEAIQNRPFGFVLEPTGVLSDITWLAEGITLDYVGSLDHGFTPAFGATTSWGLQNTIRDESTIDGFGRGFPGPGDHTLSNAAQRIVFKDAQKTVNLGVFVQELLSYKDRYFLTLGLRVDGNSSFGEDFGFQPYPKASFSYVISDEPFWQPDWGQLKLRTAYGEAGRAPGAFDAVRTWQAQGFGGIPAFLPENVGNPGLGPERTREIEAGFDGAFLDERLAVEFTYYDQKTSDALFAVAQAPSKGFVGTQLENVGGLTNKGVELNITGVPFRTGSVTWEVGGRLYSNDSEIVETGPTETYNLVRGHPAPVLRGTFVTNADELAEPILERDHFFGPTQPTHILGASTSLSLSNGIRLSAHGEFQGGHYIEDQASQLIPGRGAPHPWCADAYGHVPFAEFSPDAPGLSQIPALKRARCYLESIPPDAWVYPADYFKIRAVSIVLPASFAIPGASNASVSLSALNAWTWKNDDFIVFDPEMVGRSVNDLVRQISEHVPAPAQFVASVKIEF